MGRNCQGKQEEEGGAAGLSLRRLLRLGVHPMGSRAGRLVEWTRVIMSGRRKLKPLLWSGETSAVCCVSGRVGEVTFPLAHLERSCGLDAVLGRALCTLAFNMPSRRGVRE